MGINMILCERESKHGSGAALRQTQLPLIVIHLMTTTLLFVLRALAALLDNGQRLSASDRTVSVIGETRKDVVTVAGLKSLDASWVVRAPRETRSGANGDRRTGRERERENRRSEKIIGDTNRCTVANERAAD